MKKIQVMSIEEYNEFDDIENVILNHEVDDVQNVWMSDDEECPFVGVTYIDNTNSIVGCGIDRMVDFEEMIECLLYY